MGAKGGGAMGASLIQPVASYLLEPPVAAARPARKPPPPPPPLDLLPGGLTVMVSPSYDVHKICLCSLRQYGVQ